MSSSVQSVWKLKRSSPARNTAGRPRAATVAARGLPTSILSFRSCARTTSAEKPSRQILIRIVLGSRPRRSRGAIQTMAGAPASMAATVSASRPSGVPRCGRLPGGEIPPSTLGGTSASQSSIKRGRHTWLRRAQSRARRSRGRVCAAARLISIAWRHAIAVAAIAGSIWVTASGSPAAVALSSPAGDDAPPTYDAIR
jgi:hypothetical protein